MFSNTILICGWIMNAFKEISFLLDKAVFYFARTAYKVFYFMANVTLVSNDMIETFTQRIYAIIGLIMLFVLAFNLLNYIIDPEKVNDKKVGAVTFLKDVVIALVVITVLPQIFTMLYSLQNQVLTSNVLSNIILGGYSSSAGATDEGYERNKAQYKTKTAYYVDKGADTMVANVFVAFLTPIDEFSVLGCGTDDGTHEDYCDAYNTAIDEGSIDPFEDLITDGDYNYTPLVSTAGGVVLLFFMLSYCLELAKRAGKMAILQLLAPVPFVMEILPNKKGTRKNWIDTTVKVFLDVFMYQATIYVIVLLITFIPSAIANVFASNPSAGGFVKTVVIVLLIFGLLQFGKEAPKMISNLLGLKDSGTLGAVAKRALAMGGVTAGLLGSTGGRFARNFNATNGNFGQKLLSGVAGAGSGIGRTLWGARNVHNLKDARNLGKNINKNLVTARVNRDAYWQAHDKSLKGVVKGHIKDIAMGADAGIRGYLGTNPSSNKLSNIPVINRWNNFAGKQNLYETKKHAESINNQVKKIYGEKISSGIFRSDAIWNQISAMATQAEANGGVYIAPDGSTTSLSDLKGRLKARETDLITDKKNATKVLEALGEIQNFNDANQGVMGISSTHYDFSSLIQADGTVDIAQYNAFMADVKTNGYEVVLDSLQRDGAYQQQVVQEKLAADAKKKAADAAADANKGKK